MSLVLRRKTDGAVHVVGAAPDRHTFAPTFIERGITAGFVQVQVKVRTESGDVVYDLVDFVDDDGDRNVTAWRCDLATQEG